MRGGGGGVGNRSHSCFTDDLTLQMQALNLLLNMILYAIVSYFTGKQMEIFLSRSLSPSLFLSLSLSLSLVDMKHPKFSFSF